jgi:hypothetical protein
LGNVSGRTGRPCRAWSAVSQRRKSKTFGVGTGSPKRASRWKPPLPLLSVRRGRKTRACSRPYQCRAAARLTSGWVLDSPWWSISTMPQRDVPSGLVVCRPTTWRVCAALKCAARIVRDR